jgi:hypothetical protein
MTLDEVKLAQRAAATKFLEVAMDGIIGAAQRIVPLEEGTLAGSADRQTEQTADGVEVIGSFDTIYAARQHEELGWQHRAGRQAKYLETPFKAAVPVLERGMAAALRAVTPS